LVDEVLPQQFKEEKKGHNLREELSGRWQEIILFGSSPCPFSRKRTTCWTVSGTGGQRGIVAAKGKFAIPGLQNLQIMTWGPRHPEEKKIIHILQKKTKEKAARALSRNSGKDFEKDNKELVLIIE